MIRIEWGGETFQLHAERAAYWERRSTLIIADPHFGKAATLRHAGIPVPPGTTTANLRRLDALLESTQTTRLLVLGDFFHAAAGRAAETMRMISEWRARRAPLEVVLVRGNHDRHAGPPPREWRFDCVGEELEEGPFLFCHEFCEARSRLTMAGHVHPVILLEDTDGTMARLPCFCFGPTRALLPAFGRFTGGKRISPAPGDRVFITTEEGIAEVTLPRDAR